MLGKEQNRGLMSNSEIEAVGQGNAASTLSHRLSSQESECSDHRRKEEAALGLAGPMQHPSPLALVTTVLACGRGLAFYSPVATLLVRACALSQGTENP